MVTLGSSCIPVAQYRSHDKDNKVTGRTPVFCLKRGRKFFTSLIIKRVWSIFSRLPAQALGRKH